MRAATRLAVAIGWLGGALAGWAGHPRLGQAELLDPDVVALGTYPCTEARTARVRLHNAGEGPLAILHVIATCKCMRIDAFPRMLAPGQTGEIAVTILKNEESGAVGRVFFVETSDPDARCLKVRITGYATPLYDVACDATNDLGRIASETSWTGRYEIVATGTGYALGAPILEERGTRSAFEVRTNSPASYTVTRRVTFAGTGALLSALSFPVEAAAGPTGTPVRLVVTAFRRPAFLRPVPQRPAAPAPSPSP